MREKTFEEVHSKAWLRHHDLCPHEELFVLRQVIPWQKILKGLLPYYHEKQGRFGVSLRVIVAVLILGKLEKLGDQASIQRIQRCRYAQYFCNVSDRERFTFLNRSTLVRFRQRIGSTGCQWIETCCFEHLRKSGAIENDVSLIDSSSLPNALIYPNDVDLVYHAFRKMALWAKSLGREPWWDHSSLKKRGREYHLGKKQQRLSCLLEFHTRFVPVSKRFQQMIYHFQDSQEKKEVSIGVRCFEF